MTRSVKGIRANRTTGRSGLAENRIDAHDPA
jgi:hypothetical protein